MTSPWFRQALAAGGHLADEVAGVILGRDKIIDKTTGRELEVRVVHRTLAEDLISEDDALD